MAYKYLADTVVLIHLGFILFVVFGGLLLFRSGRFLALHLPVAVYGVLVEWGGWVCPLTPLENTLRRMAGEKGYPGGFVEHYLVPVIYPEDLTRQVQWVLGCLLLAFNAAIYFLALRGDGGRRREKKRGS